MKNKKHTKHAPHQSDIVVTMKGSTHVLLDPGFADNPHSFAIRNGVRLEGELIPATLFKKDRATGDKHLKEKANAHLVKHDAIRLFIQRDESGLWLKGIDINPGILLSDDMRRPLDEEALEKALNILKKEITPLLADPLDARHLIPGLVSDESARAYWSRVTCQLLVPGPQLKFIHGLDHPLTDPEQGREEKRVSLGARGAPSTIIFEDASWTEVSPEEAYQVQGIRVTLSLSKSALPDLLGTGGKTKEINRVVRLVGFSARNIDRAFYTTMSQMEGFYLQPPSEWDNTTNTVTHSKMIATLSVVTGVPADEIIEMYAKESQCCEDTGDEVRKGVDEAIACLTPMPVSMLFELNTEAHQPPVMP
jgi:hypothetical protein